MVKQLEEVCSMTNQFVMLEIHMMQSLLRLFPRCGVKLLSAQLCWLQMPRACLVFCGPLRNSAMAISTQRAAEKMNRI